MNSYIAFLRGINVSGQKKIKMAELRQSLSNSGLQEVQTYIQSGNIVLHDPCTNIEALEAKISKVILEDFGFQVPVVIKTVVELKEILEKNPFSGVAEEKNLYFTLLHSLPEHKSIQDFAQMKFDAEDFEIIDSCVHLNCKAGAGKAKLNNNLIEKKLKVIATTRNLNTMRKMIALGTVS